MKRIGLPLVAILATLGLTFTACSSGPPSQDDVAESLVDNADLSEDQADCVAEKVLDSDLSDDQLNAIADDDESDLSGDEVTEVGEVLGTAIVDCSTE
jgi:hypothetical protein